MFGLRFFGFFDDRIGPFLLFLTIFYDFGGPKNPVFGPGIRGPKMAKNGLFLGVPETPLF